MSLVNTMLRDLDRRRAAESERGAIPNDVRPLPESGQSRAAPALAVLAAVALALGTGAWWWLSTTRTEPAEASPSLGPAHAPKSAHVESVGSAPAPPAEPTAVALLPAAPIALEPGSGPPPIAAIEPAPAATVRRESAPGKVAPAPPQSSSETPPSPPGRLKLAGELTSRSASNAARGAASPPPMAAESAAPAIPAQEDDWRRAQSLLRDGHPEQAEPVLKRVMQAQPGHTGARNALLGILLPARRNAEAGEVLREGLAQRPAEVGWAINLARLHAIGNDYPAAWDVLERSLPHAEANAEYRAFCGTVLQRLNRGGEAITHYQAALKLNPREPRWWVGIGIALESAAKLADARDAYLHAQNLGGLTPELAAFVAQKLK